MILIQQQMRLAGGGEHTLLPEGLHAPAFARDAAPADDISVHTYPVHDALPDNQTGTAMRQHEPCYRMLLGCLRGHVDRDQQETSRSSAADVCTPPQHEPQGGTEGLLSRRRLPLEILFDFIVVKWTKINSKAKFSCRAKKIIKKC